MPDNKAEEQNNPGNQVNQGGGSAPPNNTAPAAGSQVDANQNQPSDPSRPPKGVETEFFKLRQARRDLQASNEAKDAENAQLKSRLDALERELKGRPERKSSVKADDILENPEAVLAENKRQAKEEALAAFRQEQDVSRVRSEVETATNWLLTRKHLKADPKLNAEIAYKIATDYSSMADSNPKAAARLAYLDVCQEKGIVPDLNDGKPSLPASYAGSGVAPSSNGSGEAPIITSENVKSFSRAEVEKAVREGRYKGTVIKI